MFLCFTIINLLLSSAFDEYTRLRKGEYKKVCEIFANGVCVAEKFFQQKKLNIERFE